MSQSGSLLGLGPCALDQVSGAQSGYSRYAASERAVNRRVLELSQGAHPMYNIAPLQELVRMAHSMGYEVVPKSAGQLQAEGITSASQADLSTTPSSSAVPPDTTHDDTTPSPGQSPDGQAVVR
jgi:hypothetical protein